MPRPTTDRSSTRNRAASGPKPGNRRTPPGPAYRSGSVLNDSQPVRRNTTEPAGMRPLAASNAVTWSSVSNAIRVGRDRGADVDDHHRPDERRGIDLVQQRGAFHHVGGRVEVGPRVLHERHPAVVEAIGHDVAQGLEHGARRTRPHHDVRVQGLGQVHDPQVARCSWVPHSEHAQMGQSGLIGRQSLQRVRLRGPHRDDAPTEQVTERREQHRVGLEGGDAPRGASRAVAGCRGEPARTRARSPGRGARARVVPVAAGPRRARPR